ncbi:MAG: anhydro-N-acetylmuramic acid kinase, partial [Pseudomonadota bacterium]
PSKDRPEQAGALLAFDTGPANAPLDDLVRQRTGAARDEDGMLARAGRADAAILKAALARPYMFQVPPKSLDRNDFHDLLIWLKDLSLEDAAATLVAVAAGAVAHAMTHCPARPGRVLVTGGGRQNPALMRALQGRLDCPVAPVEAAGLDGDMLEAQAFAFLAVRVARGLPTSCPSTTGVRAALGGGMISYPD